MKSKILANKYIYIYIYIHFVEHSCDWVESVTVKRKKLDFKHYNVVSKVSSLAHQMLIDISVVRAIEQYLRVL